MHNLNFKNNTKSLSVLILAFMATLVMVTSTVNVNVNANSNMVLVDTYEVIDTTNELQTWAVEEQIISDASNGMGMNDGVTNWTSSQVMAMATTTEPTIPVTSMKNSKGFISKLKKAIRSIARFIKKVINVITKIIGIIRKGCKMVGMRNDGANSVTICGIFQPAGNPIP